MSWFSSVLNIVEKTAGWMEDNPTAATMLGGAVGGYADREAIKDQNKHEERMYERRKADSLANSMPSSGIGGYGSHVAGLTAGTGLLTNGLLAKN